MLAARKILCSEGKIPGAYQEERGWKINTSILIVNNESLSPAILNTHG